MYYFIPAWYGNERPWHADIVPWYHTVGKLEFDDSIHQLRIFQEEGRANQLLLLAYLPHARYFLHRQDIFETDAYAIFDAIQGIEEEAMQVLQIKDFDWADDCEFIYTPFLVMVGRAGQLYAHIEFGIEGFISHLKFFKDGKLERLCWLDDRGFISSVVYYEGGAPSYQDYLNPQGDWRIREHLSGDDRGVKVNPAYQAAFKKPLYANIQELVFEKLGEHLVGQNLSQARFVIAAHKAHNSALFDLLGQRGQKLLTFFVDRNRGEDLSDLKEVVSKADLLLTDRQDFLVKLQEHFPEQRSKMNHSPSFDTRLQLGLSQRKRESKIYYQLDLDQVLDEYALFKILQFVGKNPLTELVIGLYNSEQTGLQKIENKVRELIDTYLDCADFIKSKEKSWTAENQLEENEESAYRFDIKNITDELTLIQELEYTRLIVDLNEQPHLYTQIAGISAGIPQINRVASEYVTHLQNGYILSEIADLPRAAHYYLDGLKNWNEALIDSINKIRENTGAQMIAKWEKWLKEAESGK